MLFLKIILIIFIFFILLVTLKLEIKIKNIKYSSEKINGRNLSNDYQIIIKIFTLEKIPIFIIRLNKLKLEKINRQTHIKQKVEQEIAKQDFTKIIEAEKKYYLKKLIPEVYRNINLEIKDINIKIEIGSDTVASYYISDLMVSMGVEKNIWTQNANETRTDTVEIGKGIQVNSSTKNTYTRIDADGNRTFNSSTNERVAEMTDKGVYN